MNKCRCDERLKTKVEESTLLGYTGFLGELEHLKIKTSLIDEKFVNVICVLEVIDVPSRFRLTRKDESLTRMLPTLPLSCAEKAARRKWKTLRLEPEFLSFFFSREDTFLGLS